VSTATGSGDGSSSPALVPAPFRRPAERRSVLDRAHRGDISGALGRVGSHETVAQRSRGRRIAALLAIMGPGVIVMVGDNEAGSLSVYGQAGQNYGLSLLWLLVPLAAILFINQEMVGRLGAVTGAGHARLIYERFGRRWGAFALADLIALCLLTIVTEFIGIDFAAGFLGIPRYVAVPVAALLLLAVTATGSFRRWERIMYGFIALNVLMIPLVIDSKPHPVEVVDGLVPGVGGSFTAGTVLFTIALVGATVAPWQLFFHQSNVVDKRITSRWLGYERMDTLIGTLFFALGAVAIIATCAFAFGGTPLHGAFVDAGSVATGLQARLGHTAAVLFVLILLNGSLFGALVVTLGASYAVGDVFGVKHSLHRRWSDAPSFYGIFALLVFAATAVVLAPDAPLGIVTTAVQALAGVLLPSALVFLLLLCNDREVLGPWTNPRWLNALATAGIGVLLVLSALLTFTILLPGTRVRYLAIGLVVALAVALSFLAGRASGGDAVQKGGGEDGSPRADWTMPPFGQLAPPAGSRARTIGLVVLRSYLTVAALLLILKTVRVLVG